MLTSIVSNSHFRKRPGARDMTILGCHVGRHISSIGYFEVFGAIYRYREVYGAIWTYMMVYASI